MLRAFVLKNAVGTSAYHWTEILRAREREMQRMGAELQPGWERTYEEQIRAGYYTQEKAGIWYGKGAQRAGLPECVTQDHLEKLLAGLDINGEQMGARLNTTRRGEAYERDGQTREILIDPATGQPLKKQVEVENRRCATEVDITVDKTISCYLEANPNDLIMPEIINRLVFRRLDLIEADIETQVNEDGKHFLRTTGNGIWMVSEQRLTRPVNGMVDPHKHFHCILMNQTWDEAEGRFKACELGKLFREKIRHQAEFDSELWSQLLEAGYGLRRTATGVELAVMTSAERDVFCKRTHQILEQIEKEQVELHKRVAANVREAAARGEHLDYDVELKRQLDAVGRRVRDKKQQAVSSTDEELRAEWSSQLAPGRWAALTIAAAKEAANENFLDAETAKRLTLEECFQKYSLVREVDLIAVACRYGVGCLGAEDVKDWIKDETIFYRKPELPGKVTTREIVKEEQAIKKLVTAGQGRYQSLANGRKWTTSNERTLDEFQLGTVKLVVETQDLVVGVLGKPGAGKTHTLGAASQVIEQLTGERPVTIAQSAGAVRAIQEAAGARDACTLALLRTDPRLQALARGRAIFCDEASLLNNDEMTWLIKFAKENGCRLSLWGDPRQFNGVERGDSFRDLAYHKILPHSSLERIYRQTGALAEITEAWHAQECERGLAKIEDAQINCESASYKASLNKVVDDTVALLKRGEDFPMLFALLHRHGDDITRALRVKLKETGLIGKEDHLVSRLAATGMSAAQRQDFVCYELGMVIQAHENLPGGIKSGQQWTVRRTEGTRVFVEREGREKELSLSSAKSFQVYRVETVTLSENDMVRVTRNQRKLGLENGNRLKIQSIDDRWITYSNGVKQDRTKPIHLAEGYTWTGEAGQGPDAKNVLAFLPADASSKLTAKAMLTIASRARDSLKMYTDCWAVVKECAVRSGEREAATYDLRQQPGKEKRTEKTAMKHRGIDLQEGARRMAASQEQARRYAMIAAEARVAQQQSQSHEMER